jgi:acetyl-CoA carboxylase biotin carboxyl carrier protein
MANVKVQSEISGSVWKIEVAVGDAVQEDDTLVLLESMKMEIPVTAPRQGKVASIDVKEGQAVAEGQLIATLDV